jgi:hypothetical protein
MKVLYIILAVVGGLVLFLWQVMLSPAVAPPTANPKFSAVISRTGVAPMLLGTRQQVAFLIDGSDSTHGTEEEEGHRFSFAAAVLAEVVQKAADGSTIYTLVTTGTPGRPTLLKTYLVPANGTARARMVQAILRELPEKGVAISKEHSKPGSPLLEDLFAACRMTGRPGSVILLSDLEQQSRLFPYLQDALTASGWERLMDKLPPLPEPPDRVLLLHVQTQNGQLGGRVLYLVDGFRRILRAWGVKDVRDAEAETGLG